MLSILAFYLFFATRDQPPIPKSRHDPRPCFRIKWLVPWILCGNLQIENTRVAFRIEKRKVPAHEHVRRRDLLLIRRHRYIRNSRSQFVKNYFQQFVRDDAIPLAQNNQARGLVLKFERGDVLVVYLPHEFRDVMPIERLALVGLKAAFVQGELHPADRHDRIDRDLVADDKLDILFYFVTFFHGFFISGYLRLFLKKSRAHIKTTTIQYSTCDPCAA